MSTTPTAAIEPITNAGDFHAPGSDIFAAAVRRLPTILGTKPDFVGLVRPGSAEELAAAVRFARAQKLAIFRLYNTSNVGARLSGDGQTLIVDLSRMNRILEVNPTYAYARVEPGVSFAELAAHLVKNNLPLLVDSERDPHASIAGSIFSKGFGYTPYGDHLLVQCGAEYVLPDGERLRSGMGAMEDNRTWQLYKFALGPYSDGLAVQSDLMIPAQTGLWLMGPAPAFRPFAMDLTDDNALAAAIETIRGLKISNTLPGTIAITHRDFDARRSGAAARKAQWRLHGALYGIPKVVDLSMAAVQATLGAVKGATLLDDDKLTTDALWQEHRALMASQPGTGALRLTGEASSASLTFVAPIEGDLATEMLAIARRIFDGKDGPLLSEFAILGRALMLTVHLPHDPAQAASTDRLTGSGRSLIQAMGDAGFGLVSYSPEYSRLAASLMNGKPLGALQSRIETALW